MARNPDLIDFRGTRTQGNSLVLMFNSPVREVVVPLPSMNVVATDGTHPALTGQGAPSGFKMYVRRWREDPGPWQYEYLFGTKPADWDALSEDRSAAPEVA